MTKSAWRTLALSFAVLAMIASPAAAKRSRAASAAATLHATPVDDASAGFGPTSEGESVITIDAATGRVLAASAADTPRYPASLTKLMTLDLAFKELAAGRLALDQMVPVSEHAAAVERVKIGLQPGSRITVRQAILAMTTMSANDAATALGELLGGGSEPQCAALMTARAHELGMAQTQFTNASGLPDPNQVTTARDLAILARDIVVHFPQFQSFFEVESFNLNGHMIYSNNELLKTYPGATGMKTGYTILAKHNLVASAERGGHAVIGVELHEPTWPATFGGMANRLDAGFESLGVPVSARAQPAAPVLAANIPLAPVKAAPAKPAARAALAANGWSAQIGSYTKADTARREALAVQRQRREGVARIARLEGHGKPLWAAQLTGLSLGAAQQTCSIVTARGTACAILAPTSHYAQSGASPHLTDPQS